MTHKLFIAVLLIPLFYSTSYSNETFCCASDYEIQSQVPSKVIPGLIVDGQTKFVCPADENIILPTRPDHGFEFECGGVRFKIQGNLVEILDE